MVKRRGYLFLILIFSLAFLLRIYKLQSYPTGLYLDEVAIGYNAYSILRTGRDEYGQFFPLWFKSFDDYKLPVYIYTVSMFELIIGKNEWSIRLPSALSGALVPVVLFFFIKHFNLNAKLALISALFLAISPWHLQFSRGGFEANMALLLFLVGTYFVSNFKWKKYLYGGLFFLILSMYTYHIYRVLVPFFIIFLIIYLRKTAKKYLQIKTLLISTGMILLMLLPIGYYSLSSAGKARIKQTFFIENKNKNNTISQAETLLGNYLSYFSIQYLFFSGDQQGRHSIREMGMIYLWQLPLLITGIVQSLKMKERIRYVFFFILFFTPLFAAFARPNPHALRSLPMIIPLTYFVSVGWNFIWRKLAKSILLQILFTAVVSYFLLFYLHIYYIHYPKRAAPDWSDQYRELSKFISGIEDRYDIILVTHELAYELGKSYIYFLFYGNVDPQTYLTTKKENGDFYKYTYVKSPYLDNVPGKKVLYISPHWENRPELLLKEFIDIGGNKLFKVWVI